jgi:hypothetical protein
VAGSTGSVARQVISVSLFLKVNEKQRHQFLRGQETVID